MSGAHGLDDPALVEFAAAARMVPLPARGDALLRLSDMELIDAIVERDGVFVLETSERGGAARPVVQSERLAPVRRALVLRLGQALRYRQRMPRLELPDRADQLPEGFRLSEGEGQLEGWTELAWDDAGESFSARFPGQSGPAAAVAFAHVARIPEDELFAALAEAEGPARLTTRG